jgi:hypothetical protein
VKKGGCATDQHFESIAIFRERLQLLGAEAEVGAAQIAPMLASALDVEGNLEDHVIAKGTYPITDEQAWKNICLAAAWVVLQAYDRHHQQTKELTA